MHPKPREEILTARLRLTRLSLHDAAAMFRAIEKNRTHLGAWLPWVDKTRKEADSRFNIELQHEAWELGSVYDFAFYTQDGSFLGRGGLHTIDWSVPCGEFGYWLTEKAQGQGYLSEAIAALETEFFNLGFERLEIRCDPRNTRSAKVAERLGYTLEGVLRRETRFQGTLRDTMVWAKLRS
mgnify:CR=1 FL=1